MILIGFLNELSHIKTDQWLEKYVKNAAK